MPLRFVLDENLRGPLWHAIQAHDLTGGLTIDATRVGNPPDLPVGTRDPELLIWAEREGRVVLSLDKRTMPVHLTAHLAAGRRSPGILVVDLSVGLQPLVDFLELAAHAGDPADYADAITSIP